LIADVAKILTLVVVPTFTFKLMAPFGSGHLGADVVTLISTVWKTPKNAKFAYNGRPPCTFLALFVKTHPKSNHLWADSSHKTRTKILPSQ
jgi:hypothetical protein